MVNSRFLGLHHRFITGIEKLKSLRDDPKYQAHLGNFNRQVVEPMDKLWDTMNNTDRKDTWKAL